MNIKNIVFTIEIDGDKSEKVITKEINVNPINNQFIHIDFLRVTDESSIHINVPIVVEGVAAGQRLGGVLVKQKSEVKVLCLPTEIPVNIKIDITKLGIGDNFRVEDIVSNSAITILSNPKDILVKVESTKLSKQQCKEIVVLILVPKKQQLKVPRIMLRLLIKKINKSLK